MTEKQERLVDEREMVRKAADAIDAVAGSLAPMTSHQGDDAKLSMALHYLDLSRLLLKEVGHGSHFDTPAEQIRRTP